MYIHAVESQNVYSRVKMLMLGYMQNFAKETYVKFETVLQCFNYKRTN